MFKYQTNLFENGRKIFTKEIELTPEQMIFHAGGATREKFLGLINTWNRQGMIGFENHGKTYVYIAM